MKLLVALLALVACSSPQQRTRSPEPGAVGFMVFDGVDETRPFGNAPRPLRLGIWYPATRGTEPRMSIDEYGRALDTETASRPTIEPGHRPGPMQALRDARPIERASPLVIYLPGFGANATVHALSCEWLARHGYTVIALASMRSSPIGMTFDFEGVDAQRRDAEWGVAAAERVLQRRFSQIAAIGVSFGSLAGWRLMVGGDERMVALVSLDGSLGFVDGAEMMAHHSPDRPARPAVLHMNTLGNGYNDLSFLEQQSFALVQVVTFDGYQHNEFFPSALFRAAPNTPQAATARARLDNVLVLAAQFIDAQVAGRRACVSPATGTTTCATPKLEIPPESEAIRLLSSATGRASLHELGRRATELGVSQPIVREGALEAVGDTAQGADRMAVFRLRVALFPASYRARWALGEELAEHGAIEEALAEFEAIKTINPRVRDVDDEIVKLRARLADRPTGSR